MYVVKYVIGKKEIFAGLKKILILDMLGYICTYSKYFLPALSSFREISNYRTYKYTDLTNNYKYIALSTRSFSSSLATWLQISF